MKKIAMIFGLALGLASLEGCSFVTSGQHGSTNATGEGWYVKSLFLISLPLSQKVFYCPKDTPTKCTSAAMQ